MITKGLIFENERRFYLKELQPVMMEQNRYQLSTLEQNRKNFSLSYKILLDRAQSIYELYYHLYLVY
jgi:hypothetical protein